MPCFYGDDNSQELINAWREEGKTGSVRGRQNHLSSHERDFYALSHGERKTCSRYNRTSTNSKISGKPVGKELIEEIKDLGDYCTKS